MIIELAQGACQTARHRTAWLETGPRNGPLLILLHGWPELSIVWRSQLLYFAQQGFRCVAPDMRGYGGSSVPDAVSAYAMRELVGDMLELHDALGGEPAIWIGHDWGSAVVWAMASHHAQRCRAVASLCVPYLARGLALPNLVPLIDRELYPADRFPVGQWDYWLYYREHFAAAAAAFEADVEGTLSLLYRAGSPDQVGNPALTASIRTNGGWFGEKGRPPAMPHEGLLLSTDDFALLVNAFATTGFAGANAWYMNDADNLAFASEAPDFGRIALPALFVHAAWDTTLNTLHSELANPMREDCLALTEATISAGHEVMLEEPDALNAAIAEWLFANKLHGLEGRSGGILRDLANP